MSTLSEQVREEYTWEDDGMMMTDPNVIALCDEHDAALTRVAELGAKLKKTERVVSAARASVENCDCSYACDFRDVLVAAVVALDKP